MRNLLIISLFTLCSTQGLSDNQASLDSAFTTYIRPILESRCIECHGADRQKGGLRLDTREAALTGGESGPALVPENASDSLLFQRVIIPPDDSDHMPTKGVSLTKGEQTLLKQWIDAGAPWTGSLVAKEYSGQVFAPGTIPETSSRDAILADPDLVLKHSAEVDKFLDTYLKESGIQRGVTVTDDIFLRRAYLDIAGRIPTLDEYEAFMESESSDRRNELISDLLDSPAFVSHTLNQWLDALRVMHKRYKLTTDVYRNWLLGAIRDNIPYDEFVRAQLTGQGNTDNPADAPAGYFIRDRNMPEDRLATTMQLFLATDMACAQCHDHPTDKWTQMDFYKTLGFLSGLVVHNTAPGYEDAVEEFGAKMVDGIDSLLLKDGTKVDRRVVQGHYYGTLGGVVLNGGFGRLSLPDTYIYDDAQPGDIIDAATPFGPEVTIDYTAVSAPLDIDVDWRTENEIKRRNRHNDFKDVNSRHHFAEWMTSPDNPMFTKTIVNRLWERVFGVPVVGDMLNLSESDMGPIPELTQYLVNLMKSLDYDQKLFLETLYNTAAYQRTSIDTPSPGEMPLGAPIVQRLSAEQMWDSFIAMRRTDPDQGVADSTLSRSGVVYLEMSEREGSERFDFATDTRPLKEKASPDRANQLPEKEIRWKQIDFQQRASLHHTPSDSYTFLGIFGQATRETIDDSVQEATITQALHLMNNEELFMRFFTTRPGFMKDSDSRLASHIHSNVNLDKETITLAYQSVLSRNPTAEEFYLVRSSLAKHERAFADLFWALVNTTEFKLKR